MEYKILEAEGVENENVDGAAFNNFISRGKSGRMQGVLNECNIYKSTSTSVTVDTGELLIHGFRVKILSPYIVERSASVSTLSHSIVARITLNLDRSVLFDMICRTTSDVLVQDPLFASESGVHEVVIAKFTTDNSGISSVEPVLPVIGQPEVMTEEYINNLVNRVWEFVREKEHPVHSIFVTKDTTDPAALYGGYWLKVKDAFLWCAGNTQTIFYRNKNGATLSWSLKAGSRGGEYAHTLVSAEMPSHSHNVITNIGDTVYSRDGIVQASVTGGWHRGFTTNPNNSDRTLVTDSVGGSQSHNIMPPYYSVNAWIRVTQEEWNNGEV